MTDPKTMITQSFGAPINPWLPDPDYHFDVRDIARNLSRIARWGGAGRAPLPVGVHSIAIAEMMRSYGPEAGLLGLLHDAAEAYFGADLPTPVKEHIPSYRRAEARLGKMIENALIPGVTSGEAWGPARALLHRLDKHDVRDLERAMLGLVPEDVDVVEVHLPDDVHPFFANRGVSALKAWVDNNNPDGTTMIAANDCERAFNIIYERLIGEIAAGATMDADAPVM